MEQTRNRSFGVLESVAVIVHAWINDRYSIFNQDSQVLFKSYYTKKGNMLDYKNLTRKVRWLGSAAHL
jgi:hypothetical protein